MAASYQRWAVEDFGSAQLGDARWTRRLVGMATRLARRPSGRVTEAFVSPAERQGAYGLLERQSVKPSAIAESLFSASARRCGNTEFVYVPVDGSSLKLTDNAIIKGFGSIGTRERGAHGLKVISALAVACDGVPLGLLSQVWWSRTGDPVGRKNSRARRPLAQKETRHWLQALDDSQQRINEAAPRTRCWFQIDREGDACAILNQLAQTGHWFTVRSGHDRRLRLGEGASGMLRSVLKAQAENYGYTLQVSTGAQRTARAAHMVVRAACVTLDLRDKRTRKHFPQQLNAVLAQEVGTTPEGEKPIEWLLLTNRPIENTQHLCEIIEGYAQRWRIEEFHRTWKSGFCNVESMQLRSVQAAVKWATLLASVAVRTERIKQLSRQEPERPASDEFTAVELKAIMLLRFGKRPPPTLRPNISQATFWLAEIGGYTGKSSGGPPGSITIARGLEQIETAVRTLQALP